MIEKINIDWINPTDKLPETPKGTDNIEVTVYNELEGTAVIVRAIFHEGDFYRVDTWKHEDKYDFKHTKYWTYSDLTPQ